MTTTCRQTNLLLLLAASFVLFTGSYVLDQAFRWTDPLEGIASGSFQICLTGFAWLFCGLVPGLLVYALYRWRGWKRFRTTAIISPGIVAVVLTITGLIASPTTPAHRLKRFTGADLPSSAREVRTHFSGGGLADYKDIYFFRCSTSDTDALIRALDLGATDRYDQQSFSTRPFPSWPDPSTWAGSTLYRGGKGAGAWFYYLRTDSSHEQVYLLVGCM